MAEESVHMDGCPAEGGAVEHPGRTCQQWLDLGRQQAADREREARRMAEHEERQRRDRARAAADLNTQFTPMQEGMAQLREVFLSLTAAGFTERQAAYVCAGILTGGGSNDGA